MKATFSLSALVCLVWPRHVKTTANAWMTHGPDAGTLKALAVSPQPPTLFAGVDGAGGFRRADASGTRTAVGSGLTNVQVNLLALAPSVQGGVGKR